MTKIISKAEVSKMTGLSETTIWRKQRKGLFPKSIQLTVGRVGWRQEDILRWLDQREKETALATIGTGEGNVS